MHIRRPLAKNIKESSYYSIMADEEQFVICTDQVDSDSNTNENLIKVHELIVKNAEILVFILKDVTA